MAEVKLDFEGDSSKAQKALDDLIKANAKLKEQIRTINNESKKGSEDSAKAAQHHSGLIREQVGELAKMVTGYVTLEKGVEAVVEAYNGWNERLNKFAESHEQFTDGLIRQLTKVGRVAKVGEYAEFIKGLKGLTPTQGLSALTAVQESAPLLGEERQRGIVKAAGPLGAALQPEDLGQVTGMAGQFASFTKGLSEEQLVSMAMTAEQRTGGKMEKFQGPKFQRTMKALVASGMDQENVIGAAMAAANLDVQPTLLTKSAEIAAASRESLMPGKREHGPAADAKRRLAAIPGGERFAAMQRDKSLAEAGFGEGAEEFGRLTPEAISAGADAMRRAEKELAQQRITAELKTSEPGWEKFKKHQAELEYTRQAEIEGPERADLLTIRKRLQTAAGARGTLARVGQGAEETLNYLREFGGSEASLRNQGYQSRAEYEIKTSFAGKEQIDLMLGELREQTKLMREEKQHKANVDAHTE
jgi:hypothetical protein